MTTPTVPVAPEPPMPVWRRKSHVGCPYPGQCCGYCKLHTDPHKGCILR